VADSGFTNGAKVEAPRRVRCEEGSGAPPHNFFSILGVKISTFDAFWVQFYAVKLLVLHAKNEYL